MSYQYSFERLTVWQELRKLVVLIYDLLKKFPKEELYSLVSQIKRAAISVSANLAEGSTRTTSKDQAHFTTLSFGSLIELMNHLYISFDLGYITEEDLNIFKDKIYNLSNQINALRNSQLNS
ncbi:MAG: four helix bundle protein [Ignavibacteriaceae bacterium]